MHCRFKDPFCSSWSPCDRCERMKDLELKKAEIEVEERVLESTARLERLRERQRAESYAALAEVVVEHPGKVLGGMAIIGLAGLGLRAALGDKKKPQLKAVNGRKK